MRPHGCIYLIRNLLNGKIYVGQTTKSLAQRWAGHLRDARYSKTGTGYPLYNAIRKYGPDGFQMVLLHQAFSPEELNAMEVRAIWAWGSLETDGGYNVRLGGGGGPHTPESCKRISASKRGVPLGPQSPEHRAKVAAHRRNLPAETRRKLSDGMRGNKNGVGNRSRWNRTSES
jgi:group I intron endonuclease